MTQPIKEIIPDLENKLQEVLNNLSNSLSEVVNFGTHILNWDMLEERKGKDNHIPTVFLRNIIETADAISILMKKSSVDPSKILLRTLIEGCFGLHYMIEKDETQRAHSFIVYKAVEKIKYCNKWLTDQQAHQSFLNQISFDNTLFVTSKWIDHPEMKKLKLSQEVVLDMPEFKAIHEEYLRTKKKYQNRPFSWYSLYDGPNNFLSLTKYLKKVERYEFFYRTFSDNVHGNAFIKGFVKAGEGQAQLIQIRDFHDAQSVTTQCVTLIIELYMNYIKARVPTRWNEFQDWYREFREPFLVLSETKLFNYQK